MERSSHYNVHGAIGSNVNRVPETPRNVAYVNNTTESMEAMKPSQQYQQPVSY